MIAVLTADLVDSTSYNEELLDKVLTTLKDEFEILNAAFSTEKPGFQIFRGDSFQGVISQPENALRVALQIKTAVNQVHFKEKGRSNAYSRLADFRMAIGIGTVGYEGENISESNGQAFQFSGRTLDKMKSETQKTRIKTPKKSVNDEFNTSFFLMDMLLERWTTASAEVVYFLLQGMKEREIADKLQISQSAVNQRKKASGWEAISGLVIRYEQVISHTFAHG